ncbi:MAG: Ig-like domain repeat protein [Acidimicrobiales bacterium]
MTFRHRFRIALAAALVAAVATLVLPALPASAAIQSPGNGSVVSGTVQISDPACGSNNCNSWPCSGAYTRLYMYNSQGYLVGRVHFYGGGIDGSWVTDPLPNASANSGNDGFVLPGIQGHLPGTGNPGTPNLVWGQPVPNGTYTIVVNWTYAAWSGGFFGGCQLSGVYHDATNVTVANPAQLSYTGPASGAWGQSVQVSARLVDPNNGSTPIANAPVSFSLPGSSANAVTSSNGVATATVALHRPTGQTSLQVSFPGNAYYEPVSSSVPFDIVGHTTSVSYTGPARLFAGTPATLTAQLTDTSSGQGIPGLPVSFRVGGQSLTGMTDAAGVASVTYTPPSPGQATLEVSFAGDRDYGPASTSAGLAIGKAPTSLSYAGPESATWGGVVSLHATLVNARSGLPVPGRLVTFSLGGVTASALTNRQGVATSIQALDPRAGPGTYALELDYPGGSTTLGSSLSVPFSVCWQYVFVSGEGLGQSCGPPPGHGPASSQGAIYLNPGSHQLLFYGAPAAPGGSPQVIGPVVDPQMNVVATPAGNEIEVAYSSSSLVVHGTFNESTGAFEAVVDTASKLYALSSPPPAAPALPSGTGATP